MAIVRNAKKKDFDYYLTNLDWDDGTEIDRSIKQFDRNEVFDHTYEKPGFYTITGTVFNSNGFHIDQYERFETRILLNASAKFP